MKVDKAIVMLNRIYNSDLRQATVAEICIGCVHFSIYDRFHEFENYNRRIQHEFDCIQNIYSKWRDLLYDLKAVGDAGMLLQKVAPYHVFYRRQDEKCANFEREGHPMDTEKITAKQKILEQASLDILISKSF